MTTSPDAVPRRATIVVLNWNSGDLGIASVRSALDQTWPDVEVLVVDNASTDDSLDRIDATFGDQISVIRNSQNLGFGPGMNTGIERASGEFVLPLNCDATLDADYVTSLVDVLDAHPRAAAAGGQVHSGRVATSGPLAITATMRTHALPHDRPVICDKVNGACPLFRRAALDQVVGLYGGPYDPSYAMYGEDIDLALTLQRLGWRYRYEPTAMASHVRSFASAPKLADRRGRLRVSTLTNRHRNIVRHAERPIATNMFALCQDVGFALLGVVRGDLGAVRDVVAAWRDHAAMLQTDRQRRASLPMRRPAMTHTNDAV